MTSGCARPHLRQLFRTPAVQGEVVCPDLRHAGVVRGHHVARRDPGEHRLPSLGMQPGVEAREAATPRPPREGDPIRIGDPLRDQRVETRDHILRLREPRVAQQGALERHAVAGRSPVVRDRDRVARVDERVGLGIEPASLVPLRSTVHAHDGGPRAVALRRRDERLNALTVRCGEPERDPRSSGGHRVAGRGDHGTSVVRHDRRHPRHVAGQEPHRTVRPDRCPE